VWVAVLSDCDDPLNIDNAANRCKGDLAAARIPARNDENTDPYRNGW
jgi:hypothetical protein